MVQVHFFTHLMLTSISVISVIFQNSQNIPFWECLRIFDMVVIAIAITSALQNNLHSVKNTLRQDKVWK